MNISKNLLVITKLLLLEIKTFHSWELLMVQHHPCTNRLVSCRTTSMCGNTGDDLQPSFYIVHHNWKFYVDSHFKKELEQTHLQKHVFGGPNKLETFVEMYKICISANLHDKTSVKCHIINTLVQQVMGISLRSFGGTWWKVEICNLDK